MLKPILVASLFQNEVKNSNLNRQWSKGRLITKHTFQYMLIIGSALLIKNNYKVHQLN